MIFAFSFDKLRTSKNPAKVHGLTSPQLQIFRSEWGLCYHSLVLVLIDFIHPVKFSKKVHFLIYQNSLLSMILPVSGLQAIIEQ